MARLICFGGTDELSMFQDGIDSLQLQRTFHWFLKSECTNEGPLPKAQMHLAEPKHMEPIIYGAECSITLRDRKQRNTRFVILSPSRLVILSQLDWIPALPSRSKITEVPPYIQLTESPEHAKVLPDANTIIINLIDIVRVEYANKRHPRGYVGGMSHLAIYFTDGPQLMQIELRTLKFWRLPYLLELAFHRNILSVIHTVIRYHPTDHFHNRIQKLQAYQSKTGFDQEDLDALGRTVMSLKAFSVQLTYKEAFLSTGLQILLPIMEVLLNMISVKVPRELDQHSGVGLEHFIQRVKHTPWKHRRKCTEANHIIPNPPNYITIPKQLTLDAIVLFDRITYVIHCYLIQYMDSKSNPIVPRNFCKLLQVLSKWLTLNLEDIPKEIYKSCKHIKVMILNIFVECFFQTHFYPELRDDLHKSVGSIRQELIDTSFDLICTWLEVKAESATLLIDKVYYATILLYYLSLMDLDSFVYHAKEDIKYRLVPCLSYKPETIPERELLVMLNYLASLVTDAHCQPLKTKNSDINKAS